MSGPDPRRITYTGRFAPSPTGPLHFGSLVAAVASYLQARTRSGRWLLRIEDIDPPRTVPGATEKIIGSLEAHGFEWDGPTLFQSRHLEQYAAVVDDLMRQQLAYRCICSREEIRQAATRTGAAGPIYPGTCRNRSPAETADQPAAIRLRTEDIDVRFRDELLGEISTSVAESVGDFVIRRKDGLFAYHLAIVVDDHAQQITEIVRGRDLLELTPAQLTLQQMLGYPSPDYFHVPIVTNDQGQKLSKQTGATALDDRNPAANLLAALKFLHQPAPAELAVAKPATIWAWALENWAPEKLRDSLNTTTDNNYKLL